MLDRPETLDPEAGFQPPDEKAVAAAITITSQVGTNRSIVVQTYLDRDASLAVFNTVIDKLTKAVDRQEARLQLEALEADLARSKKNLLRASEDFQHIEARAQKAWEQRGKKGAFRLSEAELTQKSQAVGLIERLKEEVTRLEEAIAKARGISSEE